ncbi:MAG TPA: hypothetical protein VF758_01635, partial [Candidatus Acidoferrum sp.]
MTAENGFSGSVQVTLANLPSGITTNPASPFTATAGQSTTVIFGAAANATAGTFSVTAQGTSGVLSHSAGLSLSIQAVVSQSLSRTAFVANDSRTAVDSPGGEPRRRQIVYDAAGARFFISNRAMNRVEVIPEVALTLQTTVDAPGASSADLSADGSTLWVGSDTEYIFAVNAATLQVRARYPFPALSPIPGVVFSRPTELVPLASGKLLVRLRQPAGTEALLALWDSSTNSVSDLTSRAPGVFQNGVGVLARSGDRSRVLVGANDASGELAVFDSTGNVVAGPLTVGGGTISFAAGNPDGSRFAILFTSNGARSVLLFDGSLNPLGSYSSPGGVSVVFARDGQRLFVSEVVGSANVVTALSVSNLAPVGAVPDLGIPGSPSLLGDASGASLLCGLGNHGL